MTVEMEELKAQVNNLKRQLEQERVKHNALIDSLDEGLVVIGPDGYITQVNQYAMRTLGFREDELVGERFSRVVVGIADSGHEVVALGWRVEDGCMGVRAMRVLMRSRRCGVRSRKRLWRDAL